MIRPCQPADTEALLRLAQGTGVFRPLEIDTLQEVLDDYHATNRALGHRAVCCEQDGLVLGFAYYAGLRCSEIGNLRPNQIDIEGQRIVKFHRKGSKRATVEYGKLGKLVQARLPGLGVRVDDWLADVKWLAAQRQGDQRLMPRSDPEQVIHEWPRRDLANIQTAVGLERFEFRMHDMRRTCATNLARCGMTLGAIRDILSHSSETTTLLYADMEVELDRLLADDE